jgi:hypothetical protein
VYKLILVIPFLERGRFGHVAVLDIKATTETYIPIVVDFVYVGELCFAALRSTTGHGGLLISSAVFGPTKWDHTVHQLVFILAGAVCNV